MKILGKNVRFVDAIIGLNVFIYLVDAMSRGLITGLFGLVPYLVASEPWRIITSMFLHANMSHLFVNMLALYFFGMYVLQIIDEKDLIKVYFAGGIAGSLLYASFAYLGLAEMQSIVVGASGALFGVGGALAVLRPNMQVMIFPFPVPMPMWIAELIIFLVTAGIKYVAWQGHLGGLIAGALVGYYYKKKSRRLPSNVYFVTRHY